MNRDTTKARLQTTAQLDREVREPLSQSGRLHFHHGNTTGAVWDPKDNVLARNVPAPNLDANERSADAERARRRAPDPPAYDYSIDVIKPRARAALIHKNPIKV